MTSSTFSAAREALILEVHSHMATSSTTTSSSNLHMVVQAAGAASPCMGPWTAAGAGPPVPRFRLRLPHAAALGMGQGPATPLTSSASSVQDGVDLTGRGEQHASVHKHARHDHVVAMLLVASAGAVPAGIRYTPAICPSPRAVMGSRSGCRHGARTASHSRAHGQEQPWCPCGLLLLWALISATHHPRHGLRTST